MVDEGKSSKRCVVSEITRAKHLADGVDRKSEHLHVDGTGGLEGREKLAIRIVFCQEGIGGLGTGQPGCAEICGTLKIAADAATPVLVRSDARAQVIIFPAPR